MQQVPVAATAVSSRPLLLLGIGVRAYREHLLQRIAARHPVVLADNRVCPAWAAPYLHDQLVTDLADAESVAAAVKRFAAQSPLSGVVTYLENHVELAAQLAAQLGLPGSSPAAVAACRDKAQTRQRFTAENVPSALAHAVDDEDAAVQCARGIGYPVVVKPRGMAGSAGVLRADADAEVRRAYRRATRETLPGLDGYAVPGVLVEEYLAGPEISAETVVLGGSKVRIVAVTRKRLGAEPRFVETGHSVDARDPLLTDAAVTEAVTRAVRALGIERGVLHVELRLTERGPVLIEVNARPGGDLIPLLVLRATGIDLAQATAALAAGAVPDLTPNRRQAAAIQFLYPAFSGEVTRLGAPSALLAEPWLERLVWTRRPGDQVLAPPNASISDRLAHWVVTGADAAECDQRLVQVLMQVDARTDAPVHTTSCTR
ncbi:ATP-grasp domain-containing protein [Streptomyces rubradiris]|uniref:Carboxylase n=1 Tax=Streptomyces rubradiris TaxID=285531 RepID=A0ABQ3RA89_STRRR|nr:ATP-grasp domain-containing protein [Streptomyces rubradiris]GHH25832.1 carboxylase [Streptomyces rubradiris]GHI52752.1 carboxylase [Streptomyces rubradiris]